MHLPIEPGKLFWLAWVSPYHGTEMNRPAWSLFIEAWAMLAMPLFVWASGSPVSAMLTAAGIVWLGMQWHLECLYGLLLLVGGCLSRFEWRNQVLEGAMPQWLGSVSYSLYLTHWVVLQAVGPVGATFLCLPVAWVVSVTVERNSIRLSRMISRTRRLKQSAH